MDLYRIDTREFKDLATITRIKNDLMKEGLQSRIDNLAYKIWSKKYEKNTKRLNK
jgi:hypothetical protein